MSDKSHTVFICCADLRSNTANVLETDNEFIFDLVCS